MITPPLSISSSPGPGAGTWRYYLDLTTREDVNVPLREALAVRRLANGHDRDRVMLGHLARSLPANPLSGATLPRRHPRMLPDGTSAAMLTTVRTARDRMIVTWLADSGLRSGSCAGCGSAICTCAVIIRAGNDTARTCMS
jgi:integrase